MADLRVEDVTLARAQATFRAAANRLGSVIWVLKGLNAEVVGADPLTQRLRDANSILTAELEIMGQALTELAEHASQVGTALGNVDHALSREARAAR